MCVTNLGYKIEEVLKLIEWGRALEVFTVGFGGVFVCLMLLQIAINVFSKITSGIEKLTSKGEE
ncbi:MAG: hypothetical protein JXB42_01395 [Deltaproteobacteria bacterium]|nr:hypothetical protein [Deltaproteobacteria bacterium]